MGFGSDVFLPLLYITILVTLLKMYSGFTCNLLYTTRIGGPGWNFSVLETLCLMFPEIIYGNRTVPKNKAFQQQSTLHTPKAVSQISINLGHVYP